jgi:tRNA(fMet)-specific endonuclease VapC
MNLIFDTNIILGIIRSNRTNELLEILNPENKQIFSSVITEAEIRLIAIQNRWGKEKLDKLEIFLDLFTFTEVTKQLITTYVEIDTFSQRKNPNFPTYAFDTPRNMGKNDLWTVRRCDSFNCHTFGLRISYHRCRFCPFAQCFS